MFRSKSNNYSYLLRSSGSGQLDVGAYQDNTPEVYRLLVLNYGKIYIKKYGTLPPYLAFNRSLSISCYVILNEYYVNSYNIYVCQQQYELSHSYHG